MTQAGACERLVQRHKDRDTEEGGRWRRLCSQRDLHLPAPHRHHGNGQLRGRGRAERQRGRAHLHVSQPAVTQLIRQLESRAGLHLFDRQKGRLSPTPEALALMEEVERVYDGLEAVQRKIAALRTHEDAVLRVGSMHAMASSVMPWAIAQFQRSYPRTRCVLTVDSSSGLRQALFRGAVDGLCGTS